MSQAFLQGVQHVTVRELEKMILGCGFAACCSIVQLHKISKV